MPSQNWKNFSSSDDVQRIIIDLFQHPAGNLHLRRVRARAT